MEQLTDLESTSGYAPRAAFAFMRFFLGAMWIYEAARGAPWAVPAAIVGALLLTGTFTPLAALGGAAISFIVLSHAGTVNTWGSFLWLHWLIILMHLTAMAAAAGRIWGVDAILARWKPGWPIW